MSVMDKIRNLVSKNSDKAKSGIDKASTVLNEKTGGSHSERIDKARNKAQDFVDDSSNDSDTQSRGDEGTQSRGQTEDRGDQGRTER